MSQDSYNRGAAEWCRLMPHEIALPTPSLPRASVGIELSLCPRKMGHSSRDHRSHRVLCSNCHHSVSCTVAHCITLFFKLPHHNKSEAEYNCCGVCFVIQPLVKMCIILSQSFICWGKNNMFAWMILLTSSRCPENNCGQLWLIFPDGTCRKSLDFIGLWLGNSWVLCAVLVTPL